MFNSICHIYLLIIDKKEIGMTNKLDQQSTPQKESNDDKGNQDSYKNSEPQKKPNEQPENPLKEQK
jgi:hypothetical protein